MAFFVLKVSLNPNQPTSMIWPHFSHCHIKATIVWEMKVHCKLNTLIISDTMQILSTDNYKNQFLQLEVGCAMVGSFLRHSVHLSSTRVKQRQYNIFTSPASLKHDTIKTRWSWKKVYVLLYCLFFVTVNDSRRAFGMPAIFSVC